MAKSISKPMKQKPTKVASNRAMQRMKMKHPAPIKRGKAK